MACCSGVNVYESERERNGIICRQFCGVEEAAPIFRGALKKELCKDKSEYSQKVQADVFSSDNVIGTFGAKIAIAYLLGYFSEDGHKDILNLKYIRNRFAHYSEHYSFDQQSVQDRCSNFKLINSRVRGAVAHRIRNGKKVEIDLTSCTEKGIWLNLVEGRDAIKKPRGRFVNTARLIMESFRCYEMGTMPIRKPLF